MVRGTGGPAGRVPPPPDRRGLTVAASGQDTWRGGAVSGAMASGECLRRGTRPREGPCPGVFAAQSVGVSVSVVRVVFLKSSHLADCQPKVTWIGGLRAKSKSCSVI